MALSVPENSVPGRTGRSAGGSSSHVDELSLAMISDASKTAPPRYVETEGKFVLKHAEQMKMFLLNALISGVGGKRAEPELKP